MHFDSTPSIGLASIAGITFLSGWELLTLCGLDSGLLQGNHQCKQVLECIRWMEWDNADKVSRLRTQHLITTERLKPATFKILASKWPLTCSHKFFQNFDFFSSRHVEEGRKRQETEDTELTNEFRKPRDLFLNVIAEFYSTCQPRLKSNELRRMLVDAASRPPTELLDHRSHNVWSLSYM